MPDDIQLTDDGNRFLLELHRRTDGNPAAQVSMYTLGDSLGLDKAASVRAAEELLGWDLAEVRTLAGGIGITKAGVQAARRIEGSDVQDDSPGLGRAAVPTDAARGHADALLTAVKADCPQMGLSFDALSELVSNIRTVEAQMGSPRPRTAILREAFSAILAVVEGAGRTDAAKRIRRFLNP